MGFSETWWGHDFWAPEWATVRLRDPIFIGIWRQEKLDALHLEAPMCCVKGQYVLLNLHWAVTLKHCIHTKYKMERKKESQGNEKKKNQESEIIIQPFNEKMSRFSWEFLYI